MAALLTSNPPPNIQLSIHRLLKWRLSHYRSDYPIAHPVIKFR